MEDMKAFGIAVLAVIVGLVAYEILSGLAAPKVA